MIIEEVDEYELEVLREMAREWLKNNYPLVREIKKYPPELYEGKRTYKVLMSGVGIVDVINNLKPTLTIFT